jgi:hypothetical protein
VLRIADDGFGSAAGAGGSGEGLALARAFAEKHGGGLTIEYGAFTVAELVLPSREQEVSAPRRTVASRLGLERGMGDALVDALVIGVMIVLLIVGMTVADAITLSLPPVRSLCVGGTLLAGLHCSPGG